MILKLLYKEFRLAAHPTLYIFMMMGALALIPAYPYSTVFLYGCLAPFITFQTSRENQDAFYTAMLPVRRQDIVKAKCLLMVITELCQLTVTLLVSILRYQLIPGNNPVGIEANAAYFGFGLIIFSVFNFLFLTNFYKSAYKVGKAFLIGIIPATIGMIIIEVLPHLPSLSWLDSVAAADQLKQLPVLIIGILIFLLANTTAFKLSAQRFEKVSL